MELLLPKTDVLARKLVVKFVIFVLVCVVVGRLLAKVGPRTPLNGSHSNNDEHLTCN